MLAQATREVGQACVGVAGVQHVLGDARVDVEHTPSELGDVPDLGELPLGMAFPRAGGVCKQRLEIGELSAFAFRFVDQRGGQFGLPARLVEVTCVPGDYPRGDGETSLLGAGGCGQVTKHRQPSTRVAGGGERPGLLDAQIGQAVRGPSVRGGGERPRGAPVAGAVAQVAQQLQQLTAVRGGRVRQGLLRPPLAVAICADRSRSLRRRCQQRHRLATTPRRKQVVADPLGRAAALAKARRCPQMRGDEPFGIELPASGVAEQRVAKA